MGPGHAAQLDGGEGPEVVHFENEPGAGSPGDGEGGHDVERVGRGGDHHVGLQVPRQFPGHQAQPEDEGEDVEGAPGPVPRIGRSPEPQVADPVQGLPLAVALDLGVPAAHMGMVGGDEGHFVAPAHPLPGHVVGTQAHPVGGGTCVMTDLEDSHAPPARNGRRTWGVTGSPYSKPNIY